MHIKQTFPQTPILSYFSAASSLPELASKNNDIWPRAEKQAHHVLAGIKSES